MIVHQLQISDREIPNWTTFGQFLLQTKMKRDSQGNGPSLGPIGLDQTWVLDIFTFSEVYGFYYKSHKPWSNWKLDCYKLILLYYS